MPRILCTARIYQQPLAAKRPVRKKRGRPRSAPAGKDPGTPELRQKRQEGLTQEAIDRCLERGVIREIHHKCAMRFRWLYILRYGIASTPALNLLEWTDGNPACHDESWKAKREQEYRECSAILQTYGLLQTVLQVAVFDIYPNSRHPGNTLADGLEQLRRHWRYQE